MTVNSKQTQNVKGFDTYACSFRTYYMSYKYFGPEFFPACCRNPRGCLPSFRRRKVEQTVLYSTESVTEEATATGDTKINIQYTTL